MEANKQVDFQEAYLEPKNNLHLNPKKENKKGKNIQKKHEKVIKIVKTDTISLHNLLYYMYLYMSNDIIIDIRDNTIDNINIIE